ncbi:hypothetical protein ABK040_003301 [Willaertia magna]
MKQQHQHVRKIKVLKKINASNNGCSNNSSGHRVNFVDETKKASIKKQKKKLRKPLKHVGLLQNYFEWSGNSNEVVNQFEIITVEGDSNCCSSTEEEEEIRKEEEKGMDVTHAHHHSIAMATCNSASESKIASHNLKNNQTLSNVNNNCLNSNSVGSHDNEHVESIERSNGGSLILISDYFHLKLDVEDFIRSYNEIINNNTSNVSQPENPDNPDNPQHDNNRDDEKETNHEYQNLLDNLNNNTNFNCTVFEIEFIDQEEEKEDLINFKINFEKSNLNCLNGGFCNVTSGFCVCINNFTGLNCSDKINELINDVTNNNLTNNLINNLTDYNVTDYKNVTDDSNNIIVKNETNYLNKTNNADYNNFNNQTDINNSTTSDINQTEKFICIQNVTCIFGTCDPITNLCNCWNNAYTNFTHYQFYLLQQELQQSQSTDDDNNENSENQNNEGNNEEKMDTTARLQQNVTLQYCNVLSCPSNCSNRGQCNVTNGQCLCDFPYFGDACELLQCANGCNLNHGYCNYTTGECICNDPEKYFSADCSFIHCNDPSCSGFGKCDFTSGICECDNQHYGPDCQFSFCKNNCTGHGFCNHTTAVCTCFENWMEDDCSKNRHLMDMQSIVKIVKLFGNLNVFLLPLGLTIFSYFISNFGIGGFCFVIFDILQFIGMSNFFASYNDPPLYLKFTMFFNWSNFLFDITNNNNNLQKSDVTNYYLQQTSRDLINVIDKDIRNNLIFNINFIDNFTIITTCILLTLVFSIFVILMKIIIKYKFKNINFNELSILKDKIYISIIRISLIIYMGISLSCLNQIKLTIIGNAPILTLLTSGSVFFGFILGFPILIFIILKINRDSSKNGNLNNEILLPFYSDFKKESYQFLFLILIKKFLFAFVIAFFSKFDQIIGLLCIHFIYFFIIIIIKPYRLQRRNTLQIIIESINSLHLLFVLFFQILSYNSYFSNFLTILIIILQSTSLLLSIILFIYALTCDSNNYKQFIEENYSQVSLKEGQFLTEEDLENGGTHTIFESDDEERDNEQQNNNESPFIEIERIGRLPNNNNKPKTAQQLIFGDNNDSVVMKQITTSTAAINQQQENDEFKLVNLD